jgi:NAD(P)-dependent dehydrogenase (short-subunit alcohol dehydrogenase family)
VTLGLLREGWHVALAGRRQEALEETVEAAGEAVDRALAVPTDVGNPDAVRALFAKTKETFGRLDLLFNNAGTGARGLLEDQTDDQWLGVVNTNLNGPFYCTREAFKIR